MENVKDLVPDTAVFEAFKGTNFGNEHPRQTIADTLLKYASGYATGKTSTQCCQELGLLTEDKKLSQRGKRYLYAAYHVHTSTLSNETGEGQ